MMRVPTGVSAQTMNSFRPWLVSGLVFPLLVGLAHASGVAAQNARPPRPNLLLITLDTTRADHLGCYGFADGQTPALDALAQRGTVFENAYTSSPLTLPAHATILTGLQPPEHGLRINGKARLDDGVSTLAGILQSQGYKTGAFVAAFVLNSKFGLNRGFERYDDDLTGAREQEVKQQLSRYRPGNLVVDSALAWLAQNPADDQPFFAWVHLYDPHYPYFRHDELAGTPFEGIASYDAEIAFMDMQVGRLLAFLKERGLEDRTLVVAMGDHGEGLDDHGEMEHGHMLNQEVLHVPCIATLPGRVRQGARVSEIVSSRDVYPTVRDLLAIDAGTQGEGRSLVPAMAEGGEGIESQASYAETEFPLLAYGWSPLHALTTPDFKYVRTARPELYDRRTDFAEIYNLAGLRAAQAGELERQLAGLESSMTVRAAPGVALDANEKARLAALGYVSGDQSASASEPGKPLKDIKDMLPVKNLETNLNRLESLRGYDRTRALEMARELVARSPESAAFQNRLGAALLDLGRYDEALEPLRESLRLDPQMALANLHLGRVLAGQGKYEEAVQHYRVALELDPEFADAQFSLGHALAELGQRDSAAGHLLEAIRLRPDFPEAVFRLANLLADRGYTDAALARYDEGLQLRPDNARGHYDFANLLARIDRRDEAIDQYREALRIEPGNVDARNNLAVALEAAGQGPEAVAEYRLTIAQRPDFARPHFNLGNALAKRGNFEGAIASYEEAIRLQPEWPQPQERLAWLLVTCERTELHDAKRALELAEKATAMTNRRNAYVLKTLGETYTAAGRTAEAVTTARAALQIARLERDEALAGEIEQSLARYEGQSLAARTNAPEMEGPVAPDAVP